MFCIFSHLKRLILSRHNFKLLESPLRILDSAVDHSHKVLYEFPPRGIGGRGITLAGTCWAAATDVRLALFEALLVELNERLHQSNRVIICVNLQRGKKVVTFRSVFITKPCPSEFSSDG